MIVSLDQFDGGDVVAGSYRLHFGNELRSETLNLLRILAAFRSGTALDVTLAADSSTRSDWIGDASVWNITPLARQRSSLRLFTSGTTGPPKEIVKDEFGQFLRSKKGRGSQDDIWVLSYSPYRWAGITLLGHGLKHGSKLSVPSELTPTAIIEAARVATHISLTPSMFRKILVEVGAEHLRRCPIRQVTFGGEPVNQALLDSTRDVFPYARVTHTYASTEIGDICSTSDGRAGYPLDAFRAFFLLPDGELVAFGVSTGDLWVREGDRYYFIGRKNDVVNVGGEKVSLALVDDVANQVPGVAQARATTIPSPLIGSAIVLDYVGSISPLELHALLRQRLPKAATPLKVRQVPSISLSQAGKTIR